MLRQSLLGTTVLAAALFMAFAEAHAFDESKYPDLKGQWVRARVPGVSGQPGYDPTKNQGLAQKAPLKPEFQAILEANIKDQAAGGQGGDPTYACISPGMPRIMNPYGDMEIVITPDTTHILLEHIHDSRRIFTDGRSWPTGYIEPSYRGYSIGKWLDTDGDGRYDLLEVETRGFKSPRTFEGSGLPLHRDGESVIKERIYLDNADKNLLHDEVTVIDHALTRPWTVTRHYQRDPDGVWDFVDCAENNPHVVIGNETYMMSADGYLMPTKPDQPAPDLRYFKKK